MLQNKRSRFVALALTAAIASATTADARPARPRVREAGQPVPSRQAFLLQTFTLPEAEVTRQLYVAAAGTTDNLELDVLAGALAEQAALTPNATGPQLRRAMTQLWAVLLAHPAAATYDLAGTPERRMSRLLGRIVPVLPASSRDATRAYARKYATALRAGLDQTRALTRIEGLYDQQGMYDEFRRGVWLAFIDAVRSRPALESVVNTTASPFVHTLGLRTTDRAHAMIAGRGPRIPGRPDFGPLAGFVRQHLQSDGTLVATGEEIGTLVGEASDAATALAREYTDNLFDLNQAEETYLAATQGPLPGTTLSATAPSDPKKELEEQIAIAKTRQESLDGTLKTIRGGASGTLGFVSGWFKLAGFTSDAKDIAKVAKAITTIIDGVAKYTKAAITVAEKVAKIFPGDASAAAIIGSAVLTGGLAAVAVEVFSIFGPSQPDKMEQVLKALKEIKEIVTEIKQQMNNRFNRIDEKLNRMLDTILEYFALVNWEIGETQVQVGEVQAGLYEVQSELSRLERNVYTFMSAITRQPKLEAIAGYLRYKQRTGLDMAYNPTYLAAETEFYVWARVLSKEDVLGGPLQRSYSDDSLLTELTNFPLATNINYLSQFPAMRFGLPALSTTRLSNPLDWSVASESYAQLSEEWPAHALAVAPSQLADVRDSGQRLANALNAIASPALFTSLRQHYQNAFAGVKSAIDAAEATYENDPNGDIQGVDLWGGPNQVPARSFLSTAPPLPWCSAGGPTITFDFRHADYPSYGALMIGYNMGAGTPVGSCVDGNWVEINREPTGLGGTWRFTYQLNAIVRVGYNGTRVLAHTFQTARQKTNTRTLSTPFNPNATWPPAPDVQAEFDAGIRRLPAVVFQSAPAAFMDEVRNGVNTQLAARQRAFYNRVAQQSRQAGTAISAAVRVLSGSRTLWESYVSLGLPTALEQNDYLRSLLYGSGALFMGLDLGDDDGLVNDVEDVYIYTALQPTLPAQNVMAGLDGLQAERANNLRDEITRILQAMDAADVQEGEDLVRSTLTRLSVAPQATP